MDPLTNITQAGDRLRQAQKAEQELIDPEKVTQELLSAQDFHPTDLGNAQRLVTLHGAELRFCHAWGKWLIWDGRRWAKDETDEISRRAKTVIKALYAEAGTLDEKERKPLAAHAIRSEAEGRVKAMIGLAKSEPTIPIRPTELDQDMMLLNVQNGTLDLRTGKLGPHRREDYLTKLCPVDFDILSEAPTWQKFLDRIMAGNMDLIDFLQRAVGYSLTGDTTEQCLFMLHGTGKNGKSTFLNALQALIEDYALQASFETFLLRDRGAIPNDLARLKGARLVSAIEADAGRRLAESTVKQLTGQDRVTARFLHAEYFEFTPQFKLWLAANHKPDIRGTDDAIWRRIMLIPFRVKIPESERDAKLSEHLKAELPGLLAWAVKGCLAWQDFGLLPPDEVKKATQKYRDEMDILGEFLEESCILEPDAEEMSADLYKSYTTWAEASGILKKHVMTKTKLGLCLAERGFEDGRVKGQRIWKGLRLKSPVESQQ
ncbi:MAG TPA: phage/plasmid primase, P4 family [Nitrospiria bacterium]|nr:phage/plasmid primase, P4 family [Nitrospiria bacterium]